MILATLHLKISLDSFIHAMPRNILQIGQARQLSITERPQGLLHRIPPQAQASHHESAGNTTAYCVSHTRLILLRARAASPSAASNSQKSPVSRAASRYAALSSSATRCCIIGRGLSCWPFRFALHRAGISLSRRSFLLQLSHARHPASLLIACSQQGREQRPRSGVPCRAHQSSLASSNLSACILVSISLMTET